jgi:hypothetical protein
MLELLDRGFQYITLTVTLPIVIIQLIIWIRRISESIQVLVQLCRRQNPCWWWWHSRLIPGPVIAWHGWGSCVLKVPVNSYMNKKYEYTI